MKQYSIAYGENWGNFVTKDVKIVTGNEATGFRQFVKDILLPMIR
jgi:hypothetical protein